MPPTRLAPHDDPWLSEMPDALGAMSLSSDSLRALRPDELGCVHCPDDPSARRPRHEVACG